MIVMSAMLAVLGAALIAPGWFWARARAPQSLWLYVLPALGIGAWIVLAAVGVGAQSLGNLVEMPGVAVVAVVVAYGKLVLFTRRTGAMGTIVAVGVVLLAAAAFRVLMPQLPE